MISEGSFDTEGWMPKIQLYITGIYLNNIKIENSYFKL